MGQQPQPKGAGQGGIAVTIRGRTAHFYHVRVGVDFPDRGMVERAVRETCDEIIAELTGSGSGSGSTRQPILESSNRTERFLMALEELTARGIRGLGLFYPRGKEYWLGFAPGCTGDDLEQLKLIAMTQKLTNQPRVYRQKWEFRRKDGPNGSTRPKGKEEAGTGTANRQESRQVHH